MKKYYLATYGCQMNEYDSALIAQKLDMEGCMETGDITEADFIIVTPAPYAKRQKTPHSPTSASTAS